MIEVRWLQPIKAKSGILFTLFPMFTVSMFEPKNTGAELLPIYVQLIALKFTVVSPKQFEKAEFPIEVTLLPMVTEVKLVQDEKAVLPIEVTLLAMLTEGRLVQERNASSPMEVTLLAMVTEVKPVQP